MLNTQELQTLCQTAKAAATEAGKYIQSQFNKHYEKKHKEGGTSLASQVVTEVDVKAQEIILEHLQPSANQYALGVLTEESADDNSRLTHDYFWCIDPMDGTLPFTEKRTGYAVSIALVSQAGDPVIGVVYIPDSEICYASVKGEGVTENDEPFVRPKAIDNTLQVFMDRSLTSAPYFKKLTQRLDAWANHEIVYHAHFGAVRNALGVMHAGNACYFKFPKKSKGGGSIWDYAATRLFFEELDLHVSDAFSNTLHLNNPQTTFMNTAGVIYATDEPLAAFVMGLVTPL